MYKKLIKFLICKDVLKIYWKDLFKRKILSKNKERLPEKKLVNGIKIFQKCGCERYRNLSEEEERKKEFSMVVGKMEIFQKMKKRLVEYKTSYSRIQKLIKIGWLFY